MNILKAFSKLFCKCKSPTHEDKLYVSKLPFPAFICDNNANIVAANQRLLDLLNINEQTLLNWKPNKTKWRSFDTGKTDTYEEKFFIKSAKGSKIFKVIGHINGRGKYCSVQDITVSYKTDKVISLLSRAK